MDHNLLAREVSQVGHTLSVHATGRVTGQLCDEGRDVLKVTYFRIKMVTSSYLV